MKYVLMVIDCFSKYGYGIPLRTKTGSEATKAFKSVFKKEIPRFLWVDNGTEFYNSELKALLKELNVKM